MLDHAYRLQLPTDAHSCVVFSSPHSGADYPKSFLASTRLDSLAIRSSEDAFVDDLFADAPLCGAPLLSARLPRAFVDLNRSPDDMDPALVDGVRKFGTNPRIAAGLGVIPRVVGNGQVIRAGKISLREAEDRLERYYFPYHKALSDLVMQRHNDFGMCIVIDCHSMPSDALASAPLINGTKPDIVIGDRFGASADRWVSDAVHDIFSNAGFLVARNAPFAGGYITESYGRPSKSVHAIQVEINRAVYMDEATIQRQRHFDITRQKLSGIVAQIAALGPKRLNIAAE